MALKLQQDDFRKHETQMNRDRRSLKIELKEQELAHEDVVRQLKLEHAKESTKLRQEFELNAKELQQKCEGRSCPLHPFFGTLCSCLANIIDRVHTASADTRGIPPSPQAQAKQNPFHKTLRYKPVCLLQV